MRDALRKDLARQLTEQWSRGITFDEAMQLRVTNTFPYVRVAPGRFFPTSEAIVSRFARGLMPLVPEPDGYVRIVWMEILYKARQAIGGSVTSGLRLGTDADGMVRTAHRAEVFGKLGSAERSPFRFRRDEVVKWTPDAQDRSALGHLMKAPSLPT